MIAVIAPARLASTRFPQKLLHEIHGKPLILWVADRLRDQVPHLDRYFAVDHEDLRRVVEEGGHRAVMTRVDHASGTDRLAEANAQIGADIVVNVQADEPMVTGKQIDDLTRMIEGGAKMATLATPFQRREDVLDPNQVKVVLSHDGKGIYFSRSPIPYPRDNYSDFDDAWVAEKGIYRHLGLYAYRADFLDAFCSWPEGKLESIERLEQLRAVERGESIQVALTDEPSIGIDTEEDARTFAAYLVD